MSIVFKVWVLFIVSYQINCFSGYDFVVIRYYEIRPTLPSKYLPCKVVNEPKELNTHV